MAPRWPKTAPKMAQDGPNKAPRWPLVSYFSMYSDVTVHGEPLWRRAIASITHTSAFVAALFTGFVAHAFGRDFWKIEYVFKANLENRRIDDAQSTHSA